MSKARDLADTVSTGGILDDGTVSVSEISDLTVTAAELNNVAGVNSDVQTQLDLKAPLASPVFTGNVGIGTTPTGSWNLQLATATGSSRIRMQNSTTGTTDSDGGSVAMEGNDFVLQNSESGVVKVEMGGSERMRIDGSGNVGIGTASPSSLLDVDKSQNAETNIELTNTNTGSAAQVRTKYTTDGGLFTVGKTSDAHAYTGDAYIHNVDNTNIRFATNDTERFRIGSSGQLGIGGATYGTSGQVLTSGGSGAAPTWADAAAGGSFDFTADEAITAGDTVELKSNGNIGKFSVTQSFGNSQIRTFQSNTVYNTAFVHPNNNGFAVVGYGNNNNGYYEVAVITPNAANPFSQAPVLTTSEVVTSSNTAQQAGVYDPDQDAYVFAYRDNSDSGNLNVRVGTVNSSGSWTIGSTVTADASLITDIQAVYDSNAQKVVLFYRDSDNGNKATCVVGTVNAASHTITFGTPVASNSQASTLPSSSRTMNDIVFDSTNNKVVCIFRSGFDNHGYALVGTVSGTSISFGTPVKFYASTIDGYMKAAYDSTNGYVVPFYKAGSTLRVQNLTVSGTSITTGTETVFASGRNTRDVDITDASALGSLFLAYHDTTGGGSKLTSMTWNSGTSAYTQGSTTSSHGPSQAQNLSIVYDSTLGAIYSAYTEADLADRGDFALAQVATGDQSGFVGIAAENIASGASGKVTVFGGINESLTGLTPGANYYVVLGGGLSTSGTQTAGRALASNRLLVKG